MDSLFRLRNGVLLIMLVFAMRGVFCAMTMKQLIQSMDMMRSACAPKFPNLPKEILEGLRRGEFAENRDLKCYTLCIAQMAGTVNKKKEISVEKTINQLETMLPADKKKIAIDAIYACKHIQFEHKDMCDKMFYSAKCARDFNPGEFMFP